MKRNPLETVPGLRHSPLFCISRAAEIIASNANKLASDLGLGDYKNLILLYTVSVTEGLSQADLSEILDLHPNSMVQRIDKLEGEGFLRRIRHKDNRRKHQVALTEKAVKLLGSFRQKWESLPFSREETASLKDACHKIIDGKFKQP